MIDGQFVVTVERLRDDLTALRSDFHRKYNASDRQVISPDLRKRASRLAEAWMVEVAPRRDVQGVLPADLLGNLNIAFQRLLRFAEHATQRARYDKEIRAILRDFTLSIVIPLKQAAATAVNMPTPAPPVVPPAEAFRPTAFVGHSFADSDAGINKAIIDALTSLGITVETGAKPRADRISDKVKQLIDQQHIFVGIFTCKDKIARKKEWTTSPWVIDEKAYAVAAKKRLVLLKEVGVGSIGGIQGDYEYFEFSREALQLVVLTLIRLFDVSPKGLRK